MKLYLLNCERTTVKDELGRMWKEAVRGHEHEKSLKNWNFGFI
jgi:hypothetical protein